jgi:hypothetical protein
MAYARYGDQVLAGRRAARLWMSKRSSEFAARRANYAMLRNALDYAGVCDHLEAEGVTPYAVPLLVKDQHAPALVERLTDAGIAAGTYNFDVNRNIFDPAYRPCVLVPIHGAMTGAGMDRLIEILKRML